MYYVHDAYFNMLYFLEHNVCTSLDLCILYYDIFISEQQYLKYVPSRPCINSELKSGPRAKR